MWQLKLDIWNIDDIYLTSYLCGMELSAKIIYVERDTWQKLLFFSFDKYTYTTNDNNETLFARLSYKLAADLMPLRCCVSL